MAEVSENGDESNYSSSRGSSREEVPNISSSMSREVHQGGMGILMGASFIVAEIAGAGLLNLPFAISSSGWGGLALIIVLGATVTFSGIRLSECWTIMEMKWPEYKRTKVSNAYQEIGFRSYGVVGRNIVEVALHINLLGASVVYLILIANMIESFISNVTGTLSPVSSCQLLIIVAVVSVPISWLGSPKDIWWASYIAVLSMLITLCIVMYYLITSDMQTTPHYSPPTFLGFFLGFSSILFSFGGASLFPSIQNDMKDRSSFSFSIGISFAFLTTLYMGVGGGVYYILGDNVPEDILDAVEGKLVAVAELSLAIHFFFAYIITVNPSMQGLEHVMKAPRGFSLKRVIIRSSIAMFLLLLGLTIPDFGKLLNFLGATTVTLMSFIFPPIFYWKLCQLIDPITNCIYKKLHIVEKMMLLYVLTLGVVGGAISTYSSGKAIFEGGIFNSTCFSKEEFFN